MMLLLTCLQVEGKGKVRVLTSTADRRYELQWAKSATVDGPGNGMVVRIDTATHYQEMDGFGAALTGSSCYNLMQMTPKDREKFLIRTFSPKKGMGFSYMRVSIGCSDFSLSEFTCCDQPGIENFALTSEDLDYVIPILQQVKRINPRLKILGSPWTCPIWMKVNNLEELKPYPRWTSGQLNPRYYEDYATYFVRWIQAMEAHGLKVDAITVQNEPLNRGNSASLFMGWEEQQQFIAQALGPAFERHGITTRIYAFDHNYNYDKMPEQQQYPLRVYSNEKAASFLSGAAYHNYGGNRAELKRIAAERPDKELIFTETSIGMWNDGRNLEKRLVEDMREVGLGTIENGCKAVIVWNLMLDSERGPYRPRGCSTCYGAVDIDRNDWKTLTLNSHYLLIAHLSSVVHPGAVRIGQSVQNPQEDLMYQSFKNPDDTLAFVILNQADSSRELCVQTPENKYIQLTLAPRSVKSLIW